MIQVQTNPLERLGISQEMAKRFSAQNGVGIKDLSKLIQTVSRHASTPFHTDRNQTPGADQIFKDIQQAASEIDSEEKLGATVERYLDKPASQVEYTTALFRAKLEVIQREASALTDTFGKLFAYYSFGNGLFLPPSPQIRSYFVYKPDYSTVFLTQRGGYIDFDEVYHPHQKVICEYSLDGNSNVKKSDLTTANLEDIRRVERYKGFRKLAPIVERIDKITKTGLESKEQCYLRNSSSVDLPEIKIIGIVNFGDINKYLSEVFGLETCYIEGGIFGSKSACRLKDSKEAQIKFIDEIIRNLTEGLTFEQFLPFITKLKQEHNNGMLIGLRMQEEGPRMILLGLTQRLKENSAEVLVEISYDLQ